MFWRGMLCLPSKTKTMKTEQEYCPFGQKGFFKYVSKEIFWKFTEVTSHLLIDVVKPIKNGHSREWMWHCYLDCPRLENRLFQDMLACSKRSDSGERCEVKKRWKVGGDWGDFFALLFTSSHRSPLSERLEQAKDMHARVSKYHGRRNGKKCFFTAYSSSITNANGNRSFESVLRWKLNRKIISRGNLFMRFNLYARLRKLQTVSWCL